MQIQYKWDKRHSKILHEYLSILKDRQIEYFILRNYEGLPEKNESKDVDIIIHPNKYRSAAELFIKVLKETMFQIIMLFNLKEHIVGLG